MPILQDEGLTLREAIDAHRARVGEGLLTDSDPNVAALFDAHDAVHALFGCDTSLHDEALADTWTMAATDVGVIRYLDYLRHPQVLAALDSFSKGALITGTLGAIPDAVRVLWRAWRMPTRWPFDAWRDHLDETVGELRTRYQIQPIRHGASHRAG